MIRILSCLFSIALPLLIAGCSSVDKARDSASSSDSAAPVARDYSLEGPDGPNPQANFSSTPSGLKYRILREGPGRKPTKSSFVTVSYRGWLDNGKEFDSSYNRGEPTSFPLNGVIPGWTEGMQLIGEGGKLELEIPSQLGYGPQGAGADIPPNARLHFIVELHRVKS